MTLPGMSPGSLSGPFSGRSASRRGVLQAGLGLLAGAAPLAACSSDPAFYALAPWPGTAQGGAPAVIEIRTPTVALSLDRDRIVRSDEAYRVRLAGGAAWSESLPGMIAHVLATDLQQRLPGSAVFAQNDAVATVPQAVVELSVTRFAGDSRGFAVLAGSLGVHRPGAGGAAGALSLAGPISGSGTGAMVAALSALLGQVADQAAAQLRALPAA
ncbi:MULTISPECIES: PqiC family protein [Nguyenibacter]|uniref:PqiC family protein n=1 Tax=Nguyenibacter vanlangensis TaxID=1216886 RepID=A0ABZ3D442_9PROT|nr:PqiC family protein [Nguyenibacter sp. L1]WRH87279.1 PqiC family protein [Nguyenibacter sp. L1]